VRGNFTIAALIGLSIIVAVYEGLLFYLGFETSREFEAVWGFVFVALLAIWVDADSRHQKKIYRPFEYSFLVFFFWPYIPYYLIRTRRVYGLLAVLGLAVLFYLGYLLQWAIYYAR